MKILFISDLHLPYGPKEPMRPELRRSLGKLAFAGDFLANQLEARLRYEAYRASKLTHKWLEEFEHTFGLIVNGGDNALPLRRHADRMKATEQIWKNHLKKYGERKYLALTGNHELGHGYNPEPSAFADLMKMRSSLFSLPINRRGFGYMQIKGTTLAVCDSELVYLAMIDPGNSMVGALEREQYDLMQQAFRQDGPVVILTHNTRRTREWLQRNELWESFRDRDERVALVGGHFHIPRYVKRYGAEIWWTGGASYPEPWLRWLVRVPGTGFCCEGQGAVGIVAEQDVLEIRHLPFTRDPELGHRLD